jgi:hypothetical protein
MILFLLKSAAWNKLMSEIKAQRELSGFNKWSKEINQK